MQRDIENYTQKCLERDFSDFESYMVAFWRNKILVIEPSSICGKCTKRF